MSSAGAAPRAAVPVSNARAEASRKNGARSRGPKTDEGKARSAQNALKHGMRAQKYLVLPDEDAAEFAGLEAALVEELAPVGALQTRARAARRGRRLASGAGGPIETELFEERAGESRGGGLGLALLRDGNGPRSFETLLRYRGAAMAEFWRALRTLKALQAEQAQSGRAGARDRCRPGGAPAAARGAAAARPTSATERTRARPARRNTSRASRPRPAPCTSPPPPGCRTNPRPALRGHLEKPAADEGQGLPPADPSALLTYSTGRSSRSRHCCPWQERSSVSRAASASIRAWSAVGSMLWSWSGSALRSYISRSPLL